MEKRCSSSNAGPAAKILVRTEIDHTAVMPPDLREKARIEKKFIADLRRDYGRWVQAQIAFDKRGRRPQPKKLNFNARHNPNDALAKAQRE